jgi:hypothetical protein
MDEVMVAASRAGLVVVSSARMISPGGVNPEMMRHMDAEYSAELERKNLALERLTEPRDVGHLDPDAEAEGEELTEIDLMGPDGLTFAELRAEDERVAPSPPSDGED